MERGIIIAGSGGQGILSLGRLIAYTAMLEGKNVTCFPSYGAEMRGGTANCTVIISKDTIGSPIVKNPDILIIFNCLSLERFLCRLRKGGVLFYDSSLISKERCNNSLVENNSPDYISYSIAASEEASLLGSIKYANMVMFGAFLKVTALSKLSKVENPLRKILRKQNHFLITENLKAIEEGFNSVEIQESSYPRCKEDPSTHQLLF